MTSQQARIEDLRSDQIDLLANFFHQHWRKDHIFYRDRQALRWLYAEGPAGRELGLDVACKTMWLGDTMIGLFAYFPFVLNVNGERGFGCNLSAWWTDPAHRSGPTGLRLLNELTQRGPYQAWIAGMNTPVAENIYERLRWNVVRVVPRRILVLDRATCESWRIEGTTPKEWSQSHMRPSVGAADAHIRIAGIVADQPLPAVDWDEFFWERVAPAFVGPAREASYLSWRYRQVPDFTYHRLLAESPSGIEGLLVYRVERVRDRAEKVVRIVDLVATPAAVPALVDAAVRAATTAGAALVDIFLTDPRWDSDLARAGFVDGAAAEAEGYWLPFLFQPLDFTRRRLNCAYRLARARGASDGAPMYIMKGDYEFDRPN